MKSFLNYIIERKLKYNKNNLVFNDPKEEEKIVQLFMPKISEYADRFKQFDKNELISAGLEGLSIGLRRIDKSKPLQAINFFLMQNIKGHIIDWIRKEGKLIRKPISKVDIKKNEDFEIVSIESLFIGDEIDDTLYNKITYNDTPDYSINDKLFEKINGLLKNKFNIKWRIPFYKSFGLGKYKKMKQNEIAQLYKINESTLSERNKCIINFLKTKLTLNDFDI